MDGTRQGFNLCLFVKPKPIPKSKPTKISIDKLNYLFSWLSHAYKKEETKLNQFKYNKSFGGFSNEKWFKVSGKMWHNKL